MDRVRDDGVDVVGRVAPDVAWDGEDEAGDHPFAAEGGLVEVVVGVVEGVEGVGVVDGDGVEGAEFGDVEDFEELGEEALARAGEGVGEQGEEVRLVRYQGV